MHILISELIFTPIAPNNYRGHSSVTRIKISISMLQIYQPVTKRIKGAYIIHH